jgi:hypothetical protein
VEGDLSEVSHLVGAPGWEAGALAWLFSVSADLAAPSTLPCTLKMPAFMLFHTESLGAMGLCSSSETGESPW